MNTKRPMTQKEAETRASFMRDFVTELGNPFPEDPIARRAVIAVWNLIADGLVNDDPRTPFEHTALVIRAAREAEAAASDARSHVCFLAQDWIKGAKRG